MSVFFEHTYRDGTSVRFLTKPFEPAKKEVPTIEFNFVQGGALRTLNTRLYDADEKKDFAQEFYDAIGKYLGKDNEMAEELTEAESVAGVANFVNVVDRIIEEGQAVMEPVEKPRRKHNIKKKICEDCGNEYMPTGGAQRRCDVCRRRTK